MARIKLAGMPDDEVAAIPQTLVLGTLIVPVFPDLSGVVETDLGRGLTKLTGSPAGSSASIEIIVKNYQAGPYTIAGIGTQEMLTGGTIKSIAVTGAGAQTFDQLNIKAAEFLPKFEAFMTGVDPDAMTAEILSLDWTIIGRASADFFDWDTPALGFDAALLFAGNDSFITKGGADTVHAYAGNDLINAGAGDDVAYGGIGNDTLRGLGGRDKLFGGKGNDNLQGGNNKDIVKGGAGNDIIEGGKHDDTLFGGAGRDTFLFVPDAGSDTIMDFDISRDTIRLDNVSGISITQTESGLRITHTGGTIDLLGLSDGDLSSGDILGW